jgi:hypothetical protein
MRLGGRSSSGHFGRGAGPSRADSSPTSAAGRASFWAGSSRRAGAESGSTRRPGCGTPPLARCRPPASSTATSWRSRSPTAPSTHVVSHLEPAEQPAALREFLRVVTSTGTIVVVDVPTVSPAELPRVRSVLAAHGRQAEIEWYERGHGLALADWAAGLTASGRRVLVEPLGPLLVGVAGVATDTRILNDP